MFDQRLLAGTVPSELTPHLWHSLMAFVHHDKEVIGEIVEQRERRLAGFTPVDVGRVVLDAITESEFRHHFKVVLRSHPKTLGLEEFVLAFKLGQLLLQLRLDSRHRRAHAFIARCVMGRRENNEFFEFGDFLSGDRVNNHDALNLIAKKLYTDRRFVIGRMNLDGVATHSELSADQVHVVALVLHIDKTAKNAALFVSFALTHNEHLIGIFLRIAKSVDTGHRCNNDGVAPSEQCRSCSVTKTFDLIVY
ncbi:unannotated protein [freshwater metagenome]|uniref:Unannotated protein n=1 Tax=freshwater metagenome TaxID=449393 RepID=A0A6J7VFE1_9ZZZZ